MKHRLLCRTKLLALTLAIASTLSLAASASGAEPPKAGDNAPRVEGTDQDGKPWKLADRVGKSVVLLYFYPKDDTPGCTKEACGLRDRMAELKKDGVEVVGVSFDSAESHRQFRQKYNLNFPLLADPKGKIADQFSVRIADQPVARRVSFLIGLDGKIAHITDDREAEVHLAEMKAAIAKLRPSSPARKFEVKQLESQAILSIRGKSKLAEISPTLGQWYGELHSHADSKGTKITGRPMTRFYGVDGEEMDIEAILAVAKAVEGGGRVKAGQLPAGEAVSTVHVGPYERMGETWALVLDWVREHGRETAGRGWEVYLNDPGEVKDPAKFETLLMCPLKAK